MMEWYDQDPRFNPSYAQKPTSWRHRHRDGSTHVHPYNEPCHEVYDGPEATHPWAFLEDDQLVSIPDEATAVQMAETFPDTVFFFAETVTHPNS